MELTDSEILYDLSGTKCRSCGGVKKRKMSHCQTCYFRLPQSLRSALYRGFREGYEEAYRASLEWLARHRKRAPRAGL